MQSKKLFHFTPIQTAETQQLTKNNAENVTILEPFENIYQKIVSVIKQSTQEYYNIRMVLGLKAS